MKFFGRPWYKRKKFFIPVILFSLILAVRMALPTFILKKTNGYFAEASPVVLIHFDDFDLSLIRGAYRFEGITAKTKEDNKVILKAERLDISMAWREVFKGRLLADMSVEKVEAFFRKSLVEEFKKVPDKTTKEATKRVVAFHLERLDLIDTRIVFEDYPGLRKDKPLELNNIRARISNVTPTEKYQYTFFNVQGNLEDAGAINTAGRVNRGVRPVQWDIDGEMRRFDLTQLNDLMKDKIPLTITRGTLELFAEAKSVDGKVSGYVKPFIENVDVIKREEKFKGPKHFLVEIGSALTNLVLRNTDAKTLATRIPFEFDTRLRIDTGEALNEAIQHGFEEKLQPGIENKYEIQ